MFRFAWAKSTIGKGMIPNTLTKRALERISSRGMKVENFIPEVCEFLNTGKPTSAVILLDMMQKSGITPNDEMNIAIINQLGHRLYGAEFAHECLMTLKNPHKIPSLDKLYCKVIRICNRQKKWGLAEEIFNHFENPTPELKSALALVYLQSGMSEKIHEKGLSKFVDYMDKYTCIALIHRAQTPEEALMHLERVRFQFHIEEYYSYKAKVVIRFEMYDELDELFESIKKDSQYFTRFMLNGLLKFYEWHALEKDTDKITFLRSLELRLRKRPNFLVFYEFFEFSLILCLK